MNLCLCSCDSSQRRVSEGVTPATFALSVNLPVHLSVYRTVLRRLTNSFYKGNICHVLRNEDRYNSCSFNKESQSIVSKNIRLKARPRSHYIRLSLGSENHFKRQIDSFFVCRAKHTA